MLLMAALVSAETIEADNMTFSGSIGSYKIHMVLNNKTYEGYYYYDKNPNYHFRLTKSRETSCDDSEHGSRQWCTKLTLQEYAPNNGKNSGQFRGTLKSEYESGYMLYEFTGTFTNKTNGKQYYFEVYCSEEVK